MPIADDLDVLAATMRTQRTAIKPWMPVTDYSFDARKAIEGDHPQLIRDVLQPIRLLDVGCGHGHLVRLLREQGVRAYGVDVTVPPLLASQGIQYGDVTNERTIPQKTYDVVVCREVLEHLTIRGVVLAVRTLVATSTRLIYVTTRFAKAPRSLLTVDTADDLDPTHITMLNQDLLRLLFVLEGCTRRADLEAQMDWKKLGRVLVYEVA